MANSTFYIGLSSTFHDSAIAIVDPQGEVVFAEASERYLQNKRAMTYVADDLIRAPKLVREYCGDADLVIALTWPRPLGHKLRRLNRLIRGLAKVVPQRDLFLSHDGLAWPMGSLTGGLRWLVNSMRSTGINLMESPYLNNRRSLRSYDHHLTHAATACWSSPFSESVCAILDGFGGHGPCGFFHHQGQSLERIGDKGRPTDGSLGQYYAVLCSLCGFDPICGEEWKVMGLAPYGQLDSEFYSHLQRYLSVDGLRLRVEASGPKYMRWLREIRQFAEQRRQTPQGQANLAFTGQTFFADVASQLLSNLHRLGISDNLTLGGGCALNSTFNGQILERTPFRHLHVPSAPGDDGCALGAALLAYYEDHPKQEPVAKSLSPYLGSGISQRHLQHAVQFAHPERVKHCPGTIAHEAAAILARGGIIGWMQGRAEFGPRALGHRSILADPRPGWMKDAINERVKFRERFRPFAPAILEEFAEEYFCDYQQSPYMERTLLFKEEVREQITAVVHENGSGRLQTVKREWTPRYHELISEFQRLTGVPLVLNTSFNVMGKPIIHSVEDALGVFHTSGLDALVIDEYLFLK